MTNKEIYANNFVLNFLETTAWKIKNDIVLINIICKDDVLTLRLLMSYIYIYIYIYIYMEHPFLMFLDHTQRRSTVGRTPLDE